MEIRLSRGAVFGSEAELLVYGVFSEERSLQAAVAELPEALRERARKAMKNQGFFGARGGAVQLPVSPGMSAEWVLFVGLGEKKGGVVEALREAIGTAFQLASKQGLRTISVGLSTRELQKPAFVEAVVVAARLAAYRFDTYKSQTGDARRVADVEILVTDPALVRSGRRVIEETESMMAGVSIARDLVNMPAHELTPTRLAAAAAEIAKASEKSVVLHVLSRAQCEKLGMGSYLSVAKGSDEEPKFIHLTYTPPRPTKRQIALLGKGVTFDSGGLSLKPAEGMMTMKCDMAGAAAVLGVFAALPALKPKAIVHGIIAATENMPSGKATRPGDVVRSMSGKTIEVANTDAEGRLTLADALTYAQKTLGVREIIDLATLTGACVVALGEEIAGMMTNDPTLRKELAAAAKEAGEKLWEMPLEPRYLDLIKSDVADLRNIASTRYGGSLTAALFLQEFVEPGTRWAHLDIAGPAFAERPMASYLGKGGTGYGVRSLLSYLRRTAG